MLVLQNFCDINFIYNRCLESERFRDPGNLLTALRWTFSLYPSFLFIENNCEGEGYRMVIRRSWGRNRMIRDRRRTFYKDFWLGCFFDEGCSCQGNDLFFDVMPFWLKNQKWWHSHSTLNPNFYYRCTAFSSPFPRPLSLLHRTVCLQY